VSDRQSSRSFGDWIRQALSRRIADRLREQPEVLERLAQRPEAVEKLRALGLFDPAILDPEAWEEDPVAVVRRTAAGLSRAVRERPSTLADLGVNALDVMSLGESAPAGPGAPRGEASVVFTDIEGFTAFTAAAGDEAATRLLEAHYRAVDTLVHSRGGRVVKRLGDGHLVTFGAPQAAVLASLELVEAAPADLALRAGAHAGEVTWIEHDVVGSVVNLASRVAGAAEGGESLVTEEMSVRAGAVPGVRYGPARPFRLKGFDDEIVLVPVGRS
jgi:adenylate cyclase